MKTYSHRLLKPTDRLLLAAAAVCGATLGLASTAVAIEVCSSTAHLTAWDTPIQSFGQAVGISGDTIVVGRYDDSIPGGASSGSAYVFVRSGGSWVGQQKLFASDAMPNAYFGHSVAIWGDSIVDGIGSA